MKVRPQNKFIEPFQYKPKYTPDDIELIVELLNKETMIEDIFAVIKKRHPDVSPISVYRWIMKANKERSK